MTVRTLHRTPPITSPMRGAAGAARTGIMLMPDEARAIHEMAATVNDMRVLLAGMNAKLDTAVAGHTDHETRLRAVEAAVPADLPRQLEDGKKFRWTLLGAALVIGGVAGKLGAAVPL